MKRNYLNYITLLFVCSFFATFIFVACKKDKLTDPEQNQTLSEESYMDSKSKSVVERIKSFEHKLKEINEGNLRQDVYVDVDSALWNMESLFNVTFSSPDERYVEKKIQELYFDIPMNRNNMLSMRDVNVLYEDIIKSVKEAYANDGFEQDKGLMSIVIEKGSCNTRNEQFKVVVVSGRTTKIQTKFPESVVDGPFRLDECWYYGEFGGTCDDPYLINDAAELLEDTINYYYGVKPSEKTGFRNIYVDMTCVSVAGDEYAKSNGKYYLFHKLNCDKEELYLSGAQLNDYYQNIKNVIFSKVPKDSKFSSELSDESSFMEINIDGISYMQGNDMVYDHQAYIMYGTKCEVSRAMLCSTKNILNY